jgi:hypothetical protein
MPVPKEENMAGYFAVTPERYTLVTDLFSVHGSLSAGDDDSIGIIPYRFRKINIVFTK